MLTQSSVMVKCLRYDRCKRSGQKIAFDYLNKLYDSIQLEDELLEEVALSDDGSYWYVTVGFLRPVASILSPLEKMMDTVTPKPNPQNLFKQLKYQREYKVFQIDSSTGQVRSMKMRAA